MTDRTRTAEIASLVAGGEPTAAIAARYGITPRRVRAIAAATGNAPAQAGRPRTGAVTIHTAQGRAALATLTTDAAAARLDVGAYLDRARAAITAAAREAEQYDRVAELVRADMAREDADRSADRPEVAD